jgi:hypothetical protein
LETKVDIEETDDKRLKKPVKLGLWLLGFALMPLLGLWLAHERAKTRLEAFKAQLVAKGEKLAIADHVPKLPPALSNAAPDFLAAANRLTELKAEWQPSRMRLVAPGKARVTWQQVELPTDKEPDLWPFITAHTEENRPLLTGMAVALERPEMVFDVDYSGGPSLPLPHLIAQKNAFAALVNATIVDLRRGPSSEAIAHANHAVGLTRRLREPLIISQLMRSAMTVIAQQTTWELLQSEHLSETNLKQHQQEWDALELLGDWVGALNIERASCIETYQRCREKPASVGALTGQAEIRVSFFWASWLSYADEQWWLSQHQVWLDGARSLQAHRNANLALRHAKESEAKLTPPSHESKTLSNQLISSLEENQWRIARSESVRRLTIVAIALHRHRLKHGQFPASLSALVPEFLAEAPRDFMDGQPLRYQLQPDGSFRLWSVGEDFKDDGGDATTVGANSTNPLFWLNYRDWVWPQPASDEEVRRYHESLQPKK